MRRRANVVERGGEFASRDDEVRRAVRRGRHAAARDRVGGRAARAVRVRAVQGVRGGAEPVREGGFREQDLGVLPVPREESLSAALQRAERDESAGGAVPELHDDRIRGAAGRTRRGMRTGVSVRRRRVRGGGGVDGAEAGADAGAESVAGGRAGWVGDVRDARARARVGVRGLPEIVRVSGK